MRRLALTLLLLPATALPGDAVSPTTQQQMVAGIASQFLTMHHYESRPIDDPLSACWFDSLLDQLDPGRNVLLSSDIAHFSKHQHTLDDALREDLPDLTVPFQMHARWRDRLTERLSAVHAVIDAEQTFTGTDSWAFDREGADWPADAAAADALWAQRIRADLLRGLLDERPPEETREALHKRYKRYLSDAQEAHSIDVLEPVLGSLAGCFDPHSTWMKPRSQENFDIDMSKSLEGIGAALTVDGEYVEVQRLVPGGPAERGGKLKAGDRIIGVAQGLKPLVDVVGMRLDDVVGMIRGDKGTLVRLRVLPAAGAPGQTKTIAIERDAIVLEEASAQLELKTVGEGKDALSVALIDVPSFYADTEALAKRDPEAKRVSHDVRKILDGLPDDVGAVVLDFRLNGGGSLDEAINLMGLFIDRGPVVRIRDGQGGVLDADDEDAGIAWDGPLVVLTSPMSASASEIVAAAVQDHRRGIVVGSENTHGKGTVQQLVGLDRAIGKTSGQGGALKITTHKFYRVNGGSTQLRGVRSDVIVPSWFDGIDGEAELPRAMAWDEIDPSKVTPWGPEIDVAALQAASTARAESDEALQEVAKVIARRKELADSKVLSLNLEQRKTQQGEAEVEGEDREEDPTLQEALRVVGDYAAMLRSK